MKKRKIVFAMKFIAIICVIFCISGCQSKGKNNDLNNGSDPREPLAHLAFKGNSLVYDVNDVTLTFFCGSEKSGETTNNYRDYPVVTYIYFANDKTYEVKYVANNPEGEMLIVGNEISFKFTDGFEPQNLYNKIETNQNFYVCKKILSSDTDSFYKNNTVTLKYKDTPFVANRFVEEDLWGNGSALYKTSLSYTSGVFIPDISYEFTIPKEMFTRDTGYLFFGVASYLTKDYEASTGAIYTSGQLLEHRTITIYYTKEDSKISLSSYYTRRNK